MSPCRRANQSVLLCCRYMYSTDDMNNASATHPRSTQTRLICPRIAGRDRQASLSAVDRVGQRRVPPLGAVSVWIILAWVSLN